jgi:isocitrate/isopropylmalate dehydrogenase
MLEWLGEQERAARIDGAVASVVHEGAVRTYDMGGSASTMDLAEAIASKLAPAAPASPRITTGAERS